MSNTSAELPGKPTLGDLQQYYHQASIDRGFDKETAQDIFILFAEEMGELARIVRKTSGLKSRVSAKDLDVSGELADLLIYLLHMANAYGIDLEQAFRDKEEQNKQRTWA
jgi:NTP pyrophosphatase (non-canonical NTP hydrolase)